MKSETAGAVVAGGGVMGCSILYNLAVRGLTNAVLLEQDVLASGSTGRSMGLIRTHYSNEVTAQMAWESLKVFRDFDQTVGGVSGFQQTGYFLIVGAVDRHALEQNIAMQQRLGISTRLASPQDLMETAPSLSVGEEESCVYEPCSGYADPYSVTRGYARQAQNMGASIRTGARVTDVLVEGGRVTGVATPDATISTPIVVIATGPWSKSVLEKLGIEVPLQTVRHQVIMLRRPEDEVPDRPAIGDQVNSLSARPELGGLTLVGVGEEEQASPHGYNQGVDMKVVEDVSRRLSQRIPGLTQAVFRGGWSGLFTTTPDWHPILDRVDGMEGLYCAVGFSGHGFKLSPMVGNVMAEMVLQGEATTIDVSMLGLNRSNEGRPLKSRYNMSVLA